MDMIKEALEMGRTALSEYQSKQFCAGFGIPVCREVMVGDADLAVAEARKLGFPVVLKASGEKLFHKTEVGGISLNLKSELEVRKESERILSIPGCESLIVQEMVVGHRELVCGLVRDAEFGPCVMFGIGGILTEVFQDVTFRVAPVTVWDTQQMMRTIKNARILESSRGQPACDMDSLAQILFALSRIGLQYGSVSSIDINPLVIRVEDGKPVAVDALVSLERVKERVGENQTEGSTKTRKLTQFFEPKSVAIIGASSNPGSPGHEVIRNILSNDYVGKIYLVNPKGGNILGLPVYPSIYGLPDGVDLAVIIIPANLTAVAVRECVAKGIKSIVLSAGGFSEVDGEGEQRQQELSGIIKDTGIRVIGPNTSGHISTPHNFTSTFFPLGGKIPRGNISYIAQTGNFASLTMRYIMSGENFGVARVVGLGNKIDIDESEILEYYAEDPETKAIFMYLESIKRPRRFLEVASKLTRVKPVFLFEGGSTREGALAAVTHTAALASDERITEGAIQQAGITRVNKYSYLFLVAKALASMPLPRGNRVSFLSPSGALLVVMSDLCYQQLGLTIPNLEEPTKQRLQEISPTWIRVRNPVDIWPAVSLHGIEYGYGEAIKVLMKDTNIDAIVAIMVLAEELGVPRLDFIVDLVRKYPEKPLYMHFSGNKKLMDEAKAFLEPQGVPTFLLVEEPFEVLSILNRCREAMQRP
ncbi:MAG: acetate--CoA ligase family protein [Desulfobacteraceae bacterium]|nr:acetate--CoA ligase family protein [Desulfobacteraceae bacterium]